MSHLCKALTYAVCCVTSGLARYWFGFGEGLSFGVWADFIPRSVIATSSLNVLRTEKPEVVITLPEAEVDNGLIGAHTVLQHPLRRVAGPLWDINFLPEPENLTVEVANYRKTHPSPMKADVFDSVPPGRERDRETYRDWAVGAHQSAATIKDMVDRYASRA